MSFQDTSDTIQSRLHLGELRPAWLIVALALTAVLVAVLAQALVALVGDHGFSVMHAQSAEADEHAKVTDASASDNFESSVSEPAVSLICVYVSGCVNAPGVYYLEQGARVYEALECAGGLSENAAPAYLNEARIVQDGEHIVALSVEEVAALDAGGGMPLTEDAIEASSAVASPLVNINTATSEQLQSLSGIGEATAAKIIADREKNGPFSSIEDIKRVSGIGEKKFESLAPYICV